MAGSGASDHSDWNACRIDEDCEIYVSCCAHCGGGTVISLNKAYAAYGSMSTLTFYCPHCAEAGCTRAAPQRTPICLAGVCGRRETTVDAAGVATTAVLASDGRAPTVQAEIGATIMYRLCVRSAACGPRDVATCAQLAFPARSTCGAAQRCYEAIDRMTCRPQFDLDALSAAAELPACVEAMARC